MELFYNRNLKDSKRFFRFFGNDKFYSKNPEIMIAGTPKLCYDTIKEIMTKVPACSLLLRQ